MCGIVGACAQRDVAPILLEGLRRLEYRGYDSAGVVVVNHELDRRRTSGKVDELAKLLEDKPLLGKTGIAHTRWATHGAPTKNNAHPHISSNDIAIVHNGIIENHEQLRIQLRDLGYDIISETDTELVAHLLHHHLHIEGDLLRAVQKTLAIRNVEFYVPESPPIDRLRIIHPCPK